ncbi:hypothetical protein LSAT2_026445, partial [Lamellibrachia satsuma]
EFYYLFLEYILVPLNRFNVMFQSEDTKVVSGHEEVQRLLQDLSKVPFTNRASQLDDEDLGLGTAARRFLSEGTVNAEENDDDVVKNEDRCVISPQDAAKFYNNIRSFYVALVTKMLKKLPLNNPVLKSLGILCPSEKLDHTPES